MTGAEIRKTQDKILAEHPDSWEAEQLLKRRIAETLFGSEEYVSGDAAGNTYTIDDMLAWLKTSPWHVSRLTPGTPDGTPSNRKCRPAVVMLDRRGRERWFHAATLHGAFEAAVQAVHADA